jgi:apolipoprotein N-acyltransferase
MLCKHACGTLLKNTRAHQRQGQTRRRLALAFDAGLGNLAGLKKLFSRRIFCSRHPAAIGAGLLLAAAFPKTSIAGFAWVAPALMLACAHGKKDGESFRIGYVGGLSFWLASLYWLLLIPVTGYPILGWIVLSAFVALYFGIWTWLLAGKIGSGNWARRNLWSLAGAAVWVALEMIRARFLGGFPWNLLGASQYQLTPLIQIASVTGVYGISFLVVWASLSLFSAVRMIFARSHSRFAWQSEIFLPLFAVAGLFACGEIKLAAQNPPASTLRVTLIQPSVPQSMIWDSGANSNRFQQLLALSESALTNQTGLLIWPEAALPDFDDASYVAITNLVRAHHVWMIFNADDVVPRPGATSNSDDDVFNSAFLFNPNGEFVKVYHKQKLVIFGEYVPLLLKWFTPITGGYEAGNFPVQFEMAGMKINAAPLICFEDMFPQTARGSVQGGTDFLVNLTNDGWFGKGAEQWQHMAGAVFRAVENGVPLVRCCNNGVTCRIDANGRVREIFKDTTGGVYGAGAMTIELPLQKTPPTFYNRHGDLFGWGCVILAAVVAIGKIRRNLSRKDA